MKHEFVATFLPTQDGRVTPVDHGVWTIMGGTGSLTGIRASGASSADRPPMIRTAAGDIAVVGK